MSEHDWTTSRRLGGVYQTRSSDEKWLFSDGFSDDDSNHLRSQVVLDLYAAQAGNILYSIPQQPNNGDPTEKYLKAIDDFYGFHPIEEQEYSSKYNPADEYSETSDNFLTDGCIKGSLSNSQEYVEETLESSIESPEEEYPPMFMNRSKEPEVSEVVTIKMEW